jgi:hypothetical protein
MPFLSFPINGMYPYGFPTVKNNFITFRQNNKIFKVDQSKDYNAGSHHSYKVHSLKYVSNPS